jgi:hypothetical protein
VISRALLALFLMATTATAAAAQQSGTKAPPPSTKAATKAAAGQPVQGAQGVRPETAPAELPVIMREVFDYDAAGRRDPFVSLLATTDLRPTLEELRLVALLYDESGRRPIAVMRDAANTQYRVTTGMTLGRMRVALITRSAVIFSIEEFGLNRTDSLVLSKSSNVRP